MYSYSLESFPSCFDSPASCFEVCSSGFRSYVTVVRRIAVADAAAAAAFAAADADAAVGLRKKKSNKLRISVKGETPGKIQI